MGANVVDEDVERATDQVYGAVGMPARPAPLDLPEAAVESCHEVRVCLSEGEARHVVGDGREAVDARTTLSGALASEIVRNAGGLHEPAGVRIQNDDDSDTRTGSDGTERQ